MLHQGYEAEKSHDDRIMDVSLVAFFESILAILISAVAALAPSYFKALPVTREIALYVAGAIVSLGLTTLIVGLIAKRRLAGTQVKARIRTAYASALAGSPLNPFLVAVHIAKD
jgi:membrane protein YdbS with pleckstrin-like domain